MKDLALAMAARKVGLRPYAQLVTEEGEVLEAISFPFPTDGGLAIMARQPGDPTTMAQHQLPPELVDLLEEAA